MQITFEVVQKRLHNIISVYLDNVKYPLSILLECLPKCKNLTMLGTKMLNTENHDKLLALLPHLTHIDTIQYGYNFNIPATVRAAAVHDILKLKQLKNVELQYVDLGDDTVVLTRDMTRLKSLWLDGVDMSAVSWRMSVSGLLSIQHPVLVSLENTNIDDGTVRMVQSSSLYTVTLDSKGDDRGKYSVLNFSTVHSQAS